MATSKIEENKGVSSVQKRNSFSRRLRGKFVPNSVPVPKKSWVDLAGKAELKSFRIADNPLTERRSGSDLTSIPSEHFVNGRDDVSPYDSISCTNTDLTSIADEWLCPATSSEARMEPSLAGDATTPTARTNQENLSQFKQNMGSYAKLRKNFLGRMLGIKSKHHDDLQNYLRTLNPSNFEQDKFLRHTMDTHRSLVRGNSRRNLAHFNQQVTRSNLFNLHDRLSLVLQKLAFMRRQKVSFFQGKHADFIARRLSDLKRIDRNDHDQVRRFAIELRSNLAKRKSVRCLASINDFCESNNIQTSVVEQVSHHSSPVA